MGDVFLSSLTDRRPCCVEFPSPTFCHHLNGNKLHKVQESAIPALCVGIKQARGESETNFIIYNLLDG